MLHAVHGLVDGVVLEPASQLYAFFLPPLVREGVGNLLSNLAYLDTVLNSLLQGKLEQGGSDLARFALNSTLGLAGVFDVATGMGFEEHEEDFGQTLARWGVPAGSYLVLPILGPRTVRDLAGIPVSLLTSPLPYLGQASAAGGLFGLYLVDRRSTVDGDFIRRAREAADPYAFLREAWLANREFLIRDGAPPAQEAQGEELLRELEELDLVEEPER